MHALIVAGPSGAGKSAFLAELFAGRLPPDIRRDLPAGAEDWPLVRCEWPADWQHFLADPAIAQRTEGFVGHYDITYAWWSLEGHLGDDPFWQVLACCTAMTLVVIRPPHRRLQDQWMHAHLGTRSMWSVRWRRLLVGSAGLLRAGLRRLRISPPPRTARRTHYPRPMRRLKHLERWLSSQRMPPTWTMAFYRRSENIDRMLKCWEEIVAAKAAAVPTARIEIVPTGAIGEEHAWRVEAVTPILEPRHAPERA